MSKYRTLSFIISAILFAVVVASDNSHPRRKREAPSINVHQIPKTSFSCVDRKMGEYYADPETHCQVYHVCIPGMHNKMSLISFVCPNGTIFSQATRVCTPYERVDCSLTAQFYENIHGGANSRRNDYESDYDNSVAQPLPREVIPVAPAPRQPVSNRNRNTPAPPPPPPTQPPRSPSRFRSGGSQFRGQQAPQTSTTQAPLSTPARPALPAFRQPVPAARPLQPTNILLPPRPTPRAIVSTSTSSYNYEYEYEYDYEDDVADQAGVRNKRDASDDSHFPETSFSCDGKVPGGSYADVETNCEMFHICIALGKHKVLNYKVFCASGTAFDQQTGSCAEKDTFVCEKSPLFYQFQKGHQPKSTKKPLLSKKKYDKSKHAIASKNT